MPVSGSSRQTGLDLPECGHLAEVVEVRLFHEIEHMGRGILLAVQPYVASARQ